MQIAAHDVSRLSRMIAGCAGVAVAGFGVLPLFTSSDPDGPAVALLPAGLALFLAAPATARRSVRVPARLLALIATGLGATALGDHPAAAVATVLAGLAEKVTVEDGFEWVGKPASDA